MARQNSGWTCRQYQQGKGARDLRPDGSGNQQKVDNVQFVVVGTIFPNQKNYYDSIRLLASELSVTNIEFVGG